jgi:hypothetical protein
MKKQVTAKNLKSSKIDDHMLAVGEVKRHMSALSEEFQGRVDAVVEQFSGINKKLDSHSEMIGRIMVDVQEIKSDMKQKIDRSEFSRLEKRVVILEASLYKKQPAT